MTNLPTGTVTFLFTDIEGSTRLLYKLADQFGALVKDHHRILRDVLSKHDGVEVGTEGDAFFMVFTTAVEAINAAAQMQVKLGDYREHSGTDLWVRMGLHTGEAELVGDNYGGLDVHRAARIASAARGGQVLLSAAAAYQALGSPKLAPGVRIIELGEFRLEDITEVESLFQLWLPGLPNEFPPPSAPGGNTVHLPAGLHEFIAREREVKEIRALLDRSRLVTLTGPGGTGKTTLAIEVARLAAAGFEDGVHYVDLATIVNPALVSTTIAQTLSLREEGSRPVIETVADYLAHKRSLLLLDNFEQVMAAAPHISDLLKRAPHLKVLITSRASLLLRGEHEYPVPPMRVADPARLPDLEHLGDYESVKLFVQRARSVKPDFTLTKDNAGAIAAICAALDGLPLAIELAAARVRTLAPREILVHIERNLSLLTGEGRDVPERQRTLTNAIGWSYNLLDEGHRQLFRQLGIFRGGWTLESAEAVVETDKSSAIQVIDGIESLATNSLVRSRSEDDSVTRFTMLQTIRHYALEKLTEVGELDRLRRAHAEHFAAMALFGRDHIFKANNRWADRLSTEHDNLRAGLDTMIDCGEIEKGLEMAASLWRFWQIRSHLAEGRAWVTEMLDLDDDGVDPTLRGRALLALGGLAYWQNDFAFARDKWDEALAVFEKAGDDDGIAEGLYNRAFLYLIDGDLQTAEKMFERSLALYTSRGDELNFTYAKWGLAMTFLRKRDLEAARRLGAEALETFLHHEDWFGQTLGEFALVQVERFSGNYAKALDLLRKTLELPESQKDVSTLSTLIDMLADTEIKMGRPRRGLRLAACGAHLRAEYGGGAPPPLLELDDPRDLVSGVLNPAESDATWAEAQQMAVDEVIAYARKTPDEDD